VGNSTKLSSSPQRGATGAEAEQVPLLEESQSVRDTYEVERFLGEGAFAEVYRLRHRYLGSQTLVACCDFRGLNNTRVEGEP
jgi:hypothetical protein